MTLWVEPAALKKCNRFVQWMGEDTNMYRFKNNRSVRGFTLIELMITVAIIAILVSLAVPAYLDYTARAKIAECINGSAVAKLGISEYHQTLGAWPPNLEEAGIENAGRSYFCTALNNYQEDTGTFTIDIDEGRVGLLPSVGSIAPIMTPTATSQNTVLWNCARGATAISNLKYLPSTCRDT